MNAESDLKIKNKAYNTLVKSMVLFNMLSFHNESHICFYQCASRNPRAPQGAFKVLYPRGAFKIPKWLPNTAHTYKQTQTKMIGVRGPWATPTHPIRIGSSAGPGPRAPPPPRVGWVPQADVINHWGADVSDTAPNQHTQRQINKNHQGPTTGPQGGAGYPSLVGGRTDRTETHH